MAIKFTERSRYKARRRNAGTFGGIPEKMASNIIHYAVSKRISEQIEVQDLERFLFGASVVPDISSHEDGS